MSLFALVILYLVLKFLLPLAFKILTQKAQGLKLGELQKRRVSLRGNGRPGSRKSPVDFSEEMLNIEPQPKAPSKLVVAEPYSMEDLDHDESQHQAKIKTPDREMEVEKKQPKFIPTNLRQGFIMAEILGKPKAIKEWGEEW